MPSTSAALQARSPNQTGGGAVLVRLDRSLQVAGLQAASMNSPASATCWTVKSGEWWAEMYPSSA